MCRDSVTVCGCGKELRREVELCQEADEYGIHCDTKNEENLKQGICKRCIKSRDEDGSHVSRATTMTYKSSGSKAPKPSSIRTVTKVSASRAASEVTSLSSHSGTDVCSSRAPTEVSSIHSQSETSSPYSEVRARVLLPGLRATSSLPRSKAASLSGSKSATRPAPPGSVVSDATSSSAVSDSPSHSHVSSGSGRSSLLARSKAASLSRSRRPPSKAGSGAASLRSASSEASFSFKTPSRAETAGAKGSIVSAMQQPQGPLRRPAPSQALLGAPRSREQPLNECEQMMFNRRTGRPSPSAPRPQPRAPPLYQSVQNAHGKGNVMEEAESRKAKDQRKTHDQEAKKEFVFMRHRDKSKPIEIVYSYGTDTGNRKPKLEHRPGGLMGYNLMLGGEYKRPGSKR